MFKHCNFGRYFGLTNLSNKTKINLLNILLFNFPIELLFGEWCFNFLVKIYIGSFYFASSQQQEYPEFLEKQTTEQVLFPKRKDSEIFQFHDMCTEIKH